jgi:hypothetical protein
MRPAVLIVSVVVLAAGVTVPAVAQTAAPASSTQVSQVSTSPVFAGTTRNHWTISGFAGSNFRTEAENLEVESNPSFNFGGQFGYLWGGVVGAEGLADFAPSMEVGRLGLANDPEVNAYMANAIAALPLGSRGQIQPYVSGGVGAITMRAEIPLIAVAQPLDAETDDVVRAASEGRLGTNIGGGLMMFAGHFGVRGDVRFYSAKEEDDTLPATPAGVTAAALSGLTFWRANLGLAVRW